MLWKNSGAYQPGYAHGGHWRHREPESDHQAFSIWRMVQVCAGGPAEGELSLVTRNSIKGSTLMSSRNATKRILNLSWDPLKRAGKTLPIIYSPGEVWRCEGNFASWLDPKTVVIKAMVEWNWIYKRAEDRYIITICRCWIVMVRLNRHCTKPACSEPAVNQRPIPWPLTHPCNVQLATGLHSPAVCK